MSVGVKASRLLYASPFGALIAASACSLLTSVDDLTGAGANEAGADAADVKSGDAFGADATTADAGSDAAKPFCRGLSPAPLFCQDFDEDPIMTGWTSEVFSPPGVGTVALDSTSALSFPLSLLVTVNANSAVGVGQAAFLNRDFVEAATSEAHLSFDLRLDAFDPMGKAIIASLDFGAPPFDSLYILSLALDHGTAIFEQATPNDDAGPRTYIPTSLATSPTPGKWAHVALDVAFGAVGTSAPAATVSLDGVRVLRQPLDSRQHAGLVSLGVGVAYTASPNTKVAFRYDNVVLDFK